MLAKGHCGRGVTGPPRPCAGKSSDASTSGGNHVDRAGTRPGTVSLDVIIASGTFATARYRAVPVAYLSRLRAQLRQVFRAAFICAWRGIREIGRDNACTPVTNQPLVCRLLHATKITHYYP